MSVSRTERNLEGHRRENEPGNGGEIHGPRGPHLKVLHEIREKQEDLRGRQKLTGAPPFSRSELHQLFALDELTRRFVDEPLGFESPGIFKVLLVHLEGDETGVNLKIGRMTSLTGIQLIKL